MSDQVELTPEQVEAVENMALNDDGAETVAETTPVAEQKTTEGTEGTGSEGEQGDGQADANGDSKPEGEDSNQSGRPDRQTRINQRFSELTGKLHEKDEYIESLQRDLAAISGRNQLKPPTPDEDGNITVDDMVEFSRKQAEQVAEERLTAMQTRLDGEQVAARFDREEADVLKAYPMLDPNNASLDPSDPNSYNEQLAKAVNEYVHSRIEPHIRARNVGALKGLSIKGLADEYLKPALELARAERERGRMELQAMQGQSSGMFASNQGVRSSGDTLDDLEATVANFNLS